MVWHFLGGLRAAQVCLPPKQKDRSHVLGLWRCMVRFPFHSSKKEWCFPMLYCLTCFLSMLLTKFLLFTSHLQMTLNKTLSSCIKSACLNVIVVFCLFKSLNCWSEEQFEKLRFSIQKPLLVHDKCGFSKGLPVFGYNQLQTDLYLLQAFTTKMVTLRIVRVTEVCKCHCFTQRGNAT